MNQLPRLETLIINDFVIDDVIANVSGAFHEEGLDQLTLQQLKKLWRSKLQKSIQEEPTDAVDTPKKDPKEEPVPVAQAPAQVTNKFAEAVPVTGAVQLGIKWQLQEIELPEIERRPLVRRANMAWGNAMQLDGGLPPIKEESSDEEDAENIDDMAEARASGDDESLNSNDDPKGEEAAGEELFESENVIVCQYNKVGRYREHWKFELIDGVMTLNGKDYVFKHLTGAADF